jgi:hypothetical protein
MNTTEQNSTEYKITEVCTILDPAERQRRLGQVYDLLMSLASEKQVPDQSAVGKLNEPANQRRTSHAR